MATETKRYTCAECQNTYGSGDGVQMYRLRTGEIICELCREEREERGVHVE